jgi:dTDP-4-dehydrorhamnose reductase
VASQGALKAIVLGGTGMLGSMIVRVLSRAQDVSLRATYREGREWLDPRLGGSSVQWVRFDAEREDVGDVLAGEQWIINAIGIIKPHIRENVPADVERAIKLNAVFPFSLAAAASAHQARVVQIATDCVFSGREGGYQEDSAHDALDVYGKTKSLGEVNEPHFLNLRCSILGPEVRGHLSLMDWFLSQPRGATVKGFVNHRWNGVTTLHFAQIALGLLRSNSELGGTHHVVPTDSLTKADLLREFAAAFDRSDVRVEDAKAPERIDRTLSTLNSAINDEIWRTAREDGVPSVRLMIHELAEFGRRSDDQTGKATMQ